MGGIFINYRTTEDPENLTRVLLLRDVLAELFGEGRVFLDRRSIDAGGHYPVFLRERLADAQIVLAVIHPGWRATLLEKEESAGLDWVHEELRIAFEENERDRAEGRAERKLVIPVLVGGATHHEWTDLPPDIAALGHKQARRFGTREEAEALAEELTLHFDEGFEQVPAERTGSSRPRRHTPYLVGAAAAVGVAGGLAGAPLVAELAGTAVLVLAAWFLAAVVMFSSRKGVTSAEAVVQQMSWRDYNLRVALPFALAWIVFIVFLVIGVSDPGFVGFALSGFTVIIVFMVASSLLKTRRLQQRLVDHWPVALSTPVRPVALRADMARLDLKLAEWERNGKRLPFGLRVRCRVAIADLRRGLRLLLRDGRRGRVAWALADHPALSAAVVSWVALTAGLTRFYPVTVVIAVGLAAGAAELGYRRQRWVRWAVAREVRNHTNELRSRWSVLDRRRS
ncbi:toll/interleukin-1 receptor domain-containing protein [Saccharothrix deserti]|uniref:toll/interleukin-1 receptor domain-containing protein n=1 Tax=Saccharothrix deserti TaxID=2593674 RepID=UPI00131DAB04|nr:toll/interleukin-1 receptor domain-containing protein [Saccharothrix deserti]